MGKEIQMMRMNQFKLGFLVHGEQKDYDNVGLFCTKLLEQHTDFGNPFIEACRWNVALDKNESPEKGSERRKRHLLKKTTSIYYVNIDITENNSGEIPENYLSDIWNFLIKYEGNEEMLATKMIYKRKPWQIYKPKNDKDREYINK
jgi:hypothetical protein